MLFPIILHLSGPKGTERGKMYKIYAKMAKLANFLEISEIVNMKIPSPLIKIFKLDMGFTMLSPIFLHLSGSPNYGL